jgi:hypothetical protein
MGRADRVARSLYSGRLLYIAHNVKGAKAVPFWDKLDLIGVSLYPPLGNDDDRAYRLSVMRAAAGGLDELAVRTAKINRRRRNRPAIRTGRRRETVGERGGTHSRS